jgi:hypothetical protein
MNIFGYVSTKRYVYFNDNGDITSIGSFDEDIGNYIEVELSQVEDLLSGKKQTQNYNVIFDAVEKKYVLAEKKIDNYDAFDINEYLYKIPIKNTINPDLKIIQDNASKKWIVSLKKELRQYLEEQNLIHSAPLVLSITEYNNPNILHQLIVIDFELLVLNEIVETSFADRLFNDKNNFSIYTKKKLQNYQHEVLQ